MLSDLEQKDVEINSGSGDGTDRWRFLS